MPEASHARSRGTCKAAPRVCVAAPMGGHWAEAVSLRGPLSYTLWCGGEAQTVLLCKGPFRECSAFWEKVSLSGAVVGAGLRAMNLATLKFESHLIFMCYEILILVLIFFNHFNL